MKKRRTDQEVAQRLRDVEHDVTRGLSVFNGRRTRDHAGAIDSHRRRCQRHDSARADADRRRLERDCAIAQLKRLVAELMEDNPILQDIAKEGGGHRMPATGRNLSAQAVRPAPTSTSPPQHLEAIPFDTEVSAQPARGPAGWSVGRGHTPSNGSGRSETNTTSRGR
jgi:hypothetical protein